MICWFESRLSFTLITDIRLFIFLLTYHISSSDNTIYQQLFSVFSSVYIVTAAEVYCEFVFWSFYKWTHDKPFLLCGLWLASWWRAVGPPRWKHWLFVVIVAPDVCVCVGLLCCYFTSNTHERVLIRNFVIILLVFTLFNTHTQISPSLFPSLPSSLFLSLSLLLSRSITIL